MSPIILIFSTVFAFVTITFVNGFSIKEIIRGEKRNSASFETCPTWQPFRCPNGDCIPIKYLCDGSPDCGDEYDENKSMCTAATRPPVEETTSFLEALLHAHGDDFLVKVFGPKASDRLSGMGGVEKVSVALSQSPTIEAFGTEMNMEDEEIENLTSVMTEIASGSDSILTENEAIDFRFFVKKLQETGFF